MTQTFLNGQMTPVTVVSAGPCTITQVKDARDGYQAVQVGYDETRKKISRAVAGHLKQLKQFRVLREFRMNGEGLQRGQIITADVFKPGDIVQVTGESKGKGFQGVVKRHGFAGSPKTHGHKDQLRMPGSIGSTEPKHVFRGTRMAGRMGGDRVTVHNLAIVQVDADKNLLYIKGAVPGGRNALLLISGDGELQVANPLQSPVQNASSEGSDQSEGSAVSEKRQSGEEASQSEQAASDDGAGKTE